MRVIAGSHKGRRLFSAEGRDIRPTSGRVKEALFSILGSHIEHAIFLDLYAGTGAVGIEALSRGAQWVVFVESHHTSLRLLQANIRRCQFLTAEVQPHTAEAFLRGKPTSTAVFDIVFADPPYHSESIDALLPSLDQSAMIGPNTIVLLEHPAKHRIPSEVGRLYRVRQYQYGDTAVSKFIASRPERRVP